MLRFRFKLLGSILTLFLLSACSHSPQLIGIDNPDKPAATVELAQKHKVFIATTRQATEVVGAFYSANRAPDLGFASVVVSIPPNHVPGQLERPRKMPPDPTKEFAIIQPLVYDTSAAFVQALNQSLSKLPRQEQNILLFVHGYNNTISDSILRIAQFVEDTDFTGVTVLFSWASAAKTTHYVYDLNSAFTARSKLLEVAEILAKTNAVGFDLVAHSMGALVAMEAIVQANLAKVYNRSGRLQNVLLAAPDIDIDLFRAQMSQIPRTNLNYYILVSDDDHALSFSEMISGGVKKVGSANAVELAEMGVTVIDISQIDDSSSGAHSKFAGSPEIVQLIGQSLKLGHLAKRPTMALTEMLAATQINLVRAK